MSGYKSFWSALVGVLALCCSQVNWRDIRFGWVGGSILQNCEAAMAQKSYTNNLYGLPTGDAYAQPSTQGPGTHFITLPAVLNLCPTLGLPSILNLGLPPIPWLPYAPMLPPLLMCRPALNLLSSVGSDPILL